MSHFLHSLLLDKLYAKGVYFCNFVTKSNQACTNIQPDVFNRFIGPSYMESTTRFSQAPPPSNRFSTQFTIKPIPYVASQFFVHYFHLNPLQKINKISVGSEKPTHVIFLLQRKFFLLKIAPLFSHTLTPLQTYMQYQQALLLKWN